MLALLLVTLGPLHLDGTPCQITGLNTSTSTSPEKLTFPSEEKDWLIVSHLAASFHGKAPSVRIDGEAHAAEVVPAEKSKAEVSAVREAALANNFPVGGRVLALSAPLIGNPRLGWCSDFCSFFCCHWVTKQMYPGDYAVEVSSLSPNAMEKLVYEFFSHCGVVEYVEIVRSGEHFRTAFVTFNDAYAVETAVLLSGATIADQQVCISCCGGFMDELEPFSYTSSNSVDIRGSMMMSSPSEAI
ncbi:hypothetical protein MLD38_000191 [Melastoma candidum]|uniref:Uncharacterized protein n=1 Tax=Melastoma candidum TaxID=119954 RepID=A0ACB9S9Q5_9MYRT|nr:hypothetical protein MLD38_000191 [Melastoma candidum]